MKQFEEFSIGQIWKYVGEMDGRDESDPNFDDPSRYVIIKHISDEDGIEPVIVHMINDTKETELPYSCEIMRKAFVRIS